MALQDLFDQVKALDQSAPKDVPFGQLRDKVAADNGIDPAAFKQAYDVYHTTGKVIEPSAWGHVLQGATGNLADELGGVGAKAGTALAMITNPEFGGNGDYQNLPKKNAESETAAQRAANSIYQAQHPVGSFAAEAAPMALTGVAGLARNGLMKLGATGAAKLLPKADALANDLTLMQRAKASVAPGAAIGGVYGAGAGEGGPMDRLGSTIAGTFFGGALAPVATLALGGTSKLGSAAYNKLADFAREKVLGENPLIPAGADLHPLDAKSAISHSPDQPVQVLPSKPVGASTAKAADIKIAAAAEKAGVDPVELADRIAKGEVPPNSIPFDMLGNETKDLARASSVADNPTGQKLITQMQQRNQLHNQQIGQAIQKASGLDTPDPYAFVNAAEAKAKGDAQPLYDAARSAPPVAPTAQVTLNRPGKEPLPISVENLLKQPDIAAAINEAKKGDPRLQNLPDSHPAVLDEVYKSLGDDVNSALNNGKKNAASIVMEKRDAIKQAIDSVSDGAYSKATSLYSEGMTPKNAFEEGQQAMKNGVSEADIKNQMSKYSGDALDAYKKGQLVSLSDMIAQKNLRSDITQGLLNSPLMKAKLQSLSASPEAFAGLQKTLGELHDQTAGAQFLQGGSQTAEKFGSLVNNSEGMSPKELFDKAAEIADSPTKAAVSAAGKVKDAVTSLAKKGEQTTAGAVLSRLGETDPQKQADWLRSLPALKNKLQLMRETAGASNRLYQFAGGEGESNQQRRDQSLSALRR